MSLYLDASVIVPLFLKDAFSARAFALLRATKVAVIISDWARLEIANLVARQLRIGALTMGQAEAVLANFDSWCASAASSAETFGPDVVSATQFVRKFDLSLRGLDAVHLAIARRLGATLCTFDARMEKAAAAVGLSVAT